MEYMASVWLCVEERYSAVVDELFEETINFSDDYIVFIFGTGYGELIEVVESKEHVDE